MSNTFIMSPLLKGLGDHPPVYLKLNKLSYHILSYLTLRNASSKCSFLCGLDQVKIRLSSKYGCALRVLVPPIASLVFFQLLLGSVLSPTWFWNFIRTLPLTTRSQTSVPCFSLSALRCCWDWKEDQSAVGDHLRYCTEQRAAILYGSILFQIFVPASRRIQIIWIV